MGRIQVNEIFDTMSEMEPMEKKIAYMERVVKRDPYIKRLLEMAVKPELKITRIPDGYPKNYRPESDLPVGISDTNIQTEFRRIQNYIQGGALKVLPEKKLEETWVALLQGLHYREAEIMTWVKDQILLEKYPDFWVICPVLGIETRINTEDEEEPIVNIVSQEVMDYEVAQELAKLSSPEVFTVETTTHLPASSLMPEVSDALKEDLMTLGEDGTLRKVTEDDVKWVDETILGTIKTAAQTAAETKTVEKSKTKPKKGK